MSAGALGEKGIGGRRCRKVVNGLCRVYQRNCKGRAEAGLGKQARRARDFRGVSAPELPHQIACNHQPQEIMASSREIPNLKTLLGNRRGGGLGGRGRGRGGLGSSTEERELLRDNAVKGTDQDAAGSRVSCVELGYLHDPYAKLFATQTAIRRLPLLNRGTQLAM